MIPNKKKEKENRISVGFVEDDEIPVGEQVNPDSEAKVESTSSHEGDAVEAHEGDGQLPLDVEEEHDQASITDVAELAENDGLETPAVTESTVSVVSDGDPDSSDQLSAADETGSSSQGSTTAAGPMLAELLATRAELRRVETERNDLLERLARRQADFENYRKRVERERGETYNRMVGDVVSKLLPVMDNMRRALEAESVMEKNESAEFRHFLSGVELIYKQLNDALRELGVEAVPSVGQPFDPHLHEAVATEHSEEYEPDIVTQELLRGYRLGEKLLRPAMVKVSSRQ